jgi:type II secretory ATPase GspE/PulE/Tfp pilus assembly ATPase PilB-like protein
MQPPLLSLAAAAVDAGPYINVWKILPVLVVLLIWARLLGWADKDTLRAHLPREWMNLAMLIGMILAFALFLTLPTYAIALPVMIFIFLAEVGTYLAVRNSKVGLKDLGDDFRAWKAGLRGEKAVKILAGAVTFFDADGHAMEAPETESPERPGYDGLQNLFTDPLRKGAERIDVRPSEGSSQVQFTVDGVAYSAPSLDRAGAAAAIAYLKPLAKLNVEERRKPQTGTTKVQLDGRKRELEVTTAGSSAGESVKVLIDPKKRHALRLEQLGMHPEQLQTLRDAIAANEGIVLVAAPRQQGMTSLLYALLRAHDAFIQHIQTIERSPDQDLEGITQNTLAPNSTPEDETKQAAWTISQEPDVIMINQIDDPGTARQLIDFVGNAEEGKPRRVYVGIRAGNTFDALAIWRKYVGDDSLALKRVSMVIAGRVMRKLCTACKVAYAPDPEQLKKLNLNPASANKLFQARREPLRDPKGNPIPCEFCKELRYHGRFGVYEIMVVDDDLRSVVASGGSVNQIKAAFRKQKGRLLQEVALSAVEAGDTSLAEVKRVMEAAAGEGPTGSTSSSAAAPGRGGGGGPPRSSGGGGGGGQRPVSRPPAKQGK